MYVCVCVCACVCRGVPTYETAVTRQFYHGRTETLRSCTTETIDMCRAMLDGWASVSD